MNQSEINLNTNSILSFKMEKVKFNEEKRLFNNGAQINSYIFERK